MLISLVIPTRERATYLKESLRTATAIEDSEIEIVVSDNCSSDNTQQVVESFNDHRLRYVNTGARVSMRQNFEFALTHSKGDYVAYVGDDDGFLPQQFRSLRALVERHTPDVVSWKPLTYGWPIPGFGKRVGGVRFERSRIYGQPRIMDLERASRCLRNADHSGLGGIPAIYHGCASRQFLDSIRTAHGATFGGRIPDYYISYYAILSRASCLYSHHPFTVNGYSPASTGNAHHAYAANDKRARPAVQFGNEASTDPVQDVVEGYVPTIPLNFFSTYETVCTHLGSDAAQTNYESWYRYVLRETNRADKATYDTVVSILSTYAEKSRTTKQFQAAVNLNNQPTGLRTEKVGKAFRKLSSVIQSIKCSAERDGKNTVYTAAQLIDDLLSTEIQSVLNSETKSMLAWPRLVLRGFRRSLHL